MTYTMSKTLTGFSCAHRNWRATSHCRFLHGYDRTIILHLACSEVDEHGWVFDFGDFKDIRRCLEDQFDHTTLMAHDDPARSEFMHLHESGVIDLRVMESPAIEGSAHWVYAVTNRMVTDMTDGRVWVEQVDVWENDKNCASYMPSTDHMPLRTESTSEWATSSSNVSAQWPVTA